MQLKKFLAVNYLNFEGIKMKLKDYIEQSKQELDDMEKMFIEENKTDPKNWPLEFPEEEWVDQEMSTRFSGF